MRVSVFLAVSVALIWFLANRENPQAGVANVLGENFESILPPQLTEQIDSIKAKVFKDGSEIIEESEAVKEIKRTIEEATDQIEGFPEKQKQDIKKEVIRQVCDEILKEVESGGN